MQPKVEPQAQVETPKEQRDYSSRLSGVITGSIVSIGDVFKDYRDGTKAVRFPKELLKVLSTPKLRGVNLAVTYSGPVKLPIHAVLAAQTILFVSVVNVSMPRITRATW